MEISVDGCRQNRGGDKEVSGGDLDIHQWQLCGAVDAIEIDMFDAHQDDAHKDQHT